MYFPKKQRCFKMLLFTFEKIWIDFCMSIMYNCGCIVKKVTKVIVD